jgi:hypothetical protein
MQTNCLAGKQLAIEVITAVNILMKDVRLVLVVFAKVFFKGTVDRKVQSIFLKYSTAR